MLNRERKNKGKYIMHDRYGIRTKKIINLGVDRKILWALATIL